VAKAYGLGVRDLKFAREFKILEGKTLLYLKEENLHWEVVGREKVPAGHYQTPHGRSGWK
jgi:hypothetical protein